MHLCLQLFGAVEELFQKKIVLIIVSNFRTGGNLNGKLQLSSLRKEPFLIILLTVPKTLKEESSHANSPNGLKLYNPLISIQEEAM